MSVAIIGAGRIGIAVAHLLHRFHQTSTVSISIIDTNSEALRVAGEVVPSANLVTAATPDLLAVALRVLKPETVVCCTPFSVNIQVAKLCVELQANYVDFTEDVSVTEAIRALAPTETTFVLQTGLAPGLVNSIGLLLVDRLIEKNIAPVSLKMRVGALPLVADLPSGYALTWSSAGLINEYYQPVLHIEKGITRHGAALSDLEKIIVNGEELEAFTTSGGMGAPEMYDELLTVNYKTIRYPGHLDFIKEHLCSQLLGLAGDTRIHTGSKIVENLFPYTMDDVVYMVVRATGTDSNGRTHEKVFQHKFKSTFIGTNTRLTALELTTAGTGAAVVALLAGEKLPKGIVFGGQVGVDQILSTSVGAMFLGDAAKGV